MGDALGAPMDAMTPEQVDAVVAYDPSDVPALARYLGPDGARGTDATQLMLFAAEGLLRAHARRRAGGHSDWQHDDAVSSVYQSMLRWLGTQDHDQPPPRPDGWLVAQAPMYQRRSRAAHTVRALRSGLRGSAEQPTNNSQEPSVLCGVVPVAMASWTPFALARDVAALTHGHPEAGLAAGAFATVLQKLLVGESLADAVESAWRRSNEAGGHAVARAMEAALEAADEGDPTPDRSSVVLGRGTATDALALALFATASTPTPGDAAGVAVLAGGPASRLGALAGTMSGALHGGAIPAELLEPLDLGPLVETMADDMYRHFSGVPFTLDEDEWERFPG